MSSLLFNKLLYSCSDAPCGKTHGEEEGGKESLRGTDESLFMCALKSELEKQTENESHSY